LAQEVGVLPLGELGGAGERFQREAADEAGRDAGRAGVHRLHGGDLVGALDFDEVVGVGDLEEAVEAVALDLARDDAAGALGVRLGKRAAAGVEEDEGEGAGLVDRADAPGMVGAAGRLVLGDGDGEGRDLAVDSVGGGGGAAVDQVDRL
jgi:hypothetical protein